MGKIQTYVDVEFVAAFPPLYKGENACTLLNQASDRFERMSSRSSKLPLKVEG
jgi:hypothetical protein